MLQNELSFQINVMALMNKETCMDIWVRFSKFFWMSEKFLIAFFWLRQFIYIEEGRLIGTFSVKHTRIRLGFCGLHNVDMQAIKI